MNYQKECDMTGEYRNVIILVLVKQQRQSSIYFSLHTPKYLKYKNDSGIWSKPSTSKNSENQNDITKTPPNNFDYTAIADRLSQFDLRLPPNYD